MVSHNLLEPGLKNSPDQSVVGDTDKAKGTIHSSSSTEKLVKLPHW